MLRVEHMAKGLGDFRIEDVSFDVSEGDYFVLLGASGTGKTVVLECLAGLVAPDAGRILWDGGDITHAPIQKRRMGLVHQDQALFPHLTVYQNLAYGLRRIGLGRKGLRERVLRVAERVGVTDLEHRFPGTLSGGEAQRVALGRALAAEPRCLLLDEPLSSLDTPVRSEMRALLRGLHRGGQTVLHVTHDFEEAISLATRVGIMEGGRIAQIGTSTEVFQHPKSEFVARFVGIRNVFSGAIEAMADGNGTLKRFMAPGFAVSVLTEACPGPGYLIVRSEDLTLSASESETSARNSYHGVVADMAPARLGMEVIIDVGVELAAVITAGSVERLGIEPGRRIWVSFKASAARFIEE